MSTLLDSLGGAVFEHSVVFHMNGDGGVRSFVNDDTVDTIVKRDVVLKDHQTFVAGVASDVDALTIYNIVLVVFSIVGIASSKVRQSSTLEER